MRTSLKKLFPLLISTLLIVPSCDSFDKGTLQMELFIATDTHLLSNDLLSPSNTKYTKNRLTSDGRIQEYDYKLMEQVINDINTSQPDYFILTGDLTFNGEKESHEAMVSFLNQISQNTKALVLPGNHDTYNLYATSMKEDKSEKITSITSDDFRLLYQNYGYRGALTYDEATLSYIYPLSNDTWALMIDTSLNRYNVEEGMNLIGGYLEEPTLKWIESNLKYASENNIQVLSFSHHNLLRHHSKFDRLYKLQNADQLLDIYQKYHVQINFSGHLHIQSISTKEQKEFYDIAQGSMLTYQNSYGIFNKYENCFEYHMKSIELPNESLQEYSYQTFYQRYYDKVLPTYQKNYSEEDAKRISDLLSQINSYYFSGEYEKMHKVYHKNKDILQQVIDSNDYLKEVIANPNVNQDFLRIIRE